MRGCPRAANRVQRSERRDRTMSKRMAAAVFMFLIIACTWTGRHGGTTTVSVVSLANATAATIDGQVTMGGNPLPGATVTLTGPFAGSRTVVSDVNGVYH